MDQQQGGVQLLLWVADLGRCGSNVARERRVIRGARTEVFFFDRKKKSVLLPGVVPLKPSNFVLSPFYTRLHM